MDRPFLLSPRWMQLGLFLFASSAASSLLGQMPAIYPGHQPRSYRESHFEGIVYAMRDGYAIVEAEDLFLSNYWELRTDESGDNWGCTTNPVPPNTAYTGTGYMRYIGDNLICNSLRDRFDPGAADPPQDNNHNDETQSCQGDRRHWMVFKVYVPVAGTYNVRPRVFHQQDDGDNDFWCHVIGMPGKVKREGDCTTNSYVWPTWGPHRFQLQEGVNAIYIGGRSKGIGIDRIVVYADGTEGQALDVSRQASSEYTNMSQWRSDVFGEAADSPEAEDSADFDGDGATNIEEFAGGSDPTNPAAKPLLAMRIEPGEVGAEFQLDPEVNVLELVVEQLVEGAGSSWEAIAHRPASGEWAALVESIAVNYNEETGLLRVSRSMDSQSGVLCRLRITLP